MELATFLEEIREDGEFTSEGGFSLRLDEARRKLQSFQLDEPYAYILLLVTALVARGADAVEFRFGRGWLNIRAEAEPWDEDELKNLFSDFLTGRTQVGTNDLALGLNCALNLLPKRLMVESRLVEEKVVWDLISDRIERELPHRGTGVVIRIERPTGFKAWLMNMRGYVGFPPELRLVDSHCEYAGVPVVVNYVKINRPIFLGEAPAVLRLGRVEANYQTVFVFRREVEGLEGALALGRGEIEWVVDGISTGKLEGPGLRGVLVTSRVQRDLSRRAVVQNEAYIEVLEELVTLRDEMVNQLCGELEGILEEMLPDYLGPIEEAVRSGTDLTPEAREALERCYSENHDLPRA